MLSAPTRMIDGCGRRTERRAVPAGLVLLSNRGPVEHGVATDGSVSSCRSCGGVPTALASLSERVDFTWIAGAVTEGDRHVAMSGPIVLPGLRSAGLRFVTIPPDIYHNYCTTFSNRVLWFLQHSMWDLLQMHDPKATMAAAWQNGYAAANAEFAKAAIRACSGWNGKPTILVQDYHLYLAPGYIRHQMPQALIQHFTHIPWPAPAKWLVLPAAIRQSLLRSLLASDVVGFQTPGSVSNFLRSCAAFLPGAKVDRLASTVSFDGHFTWVRDYPISIDVRAVRKLSRSTAADQCRAMLELSCGEPTIVRVDRLDPSKNIVRGFQAFDLMLERYPHLRDTARFLAFLAPTRGTVPEYQRYAANVFSAARSINEKYSGDGRGPIKVYYENNYCQALAGMSVADVMIVNPLADGMNLVAKEAAIANMRNGSVLLSRSAGAYEELASGVTPVEPLDIEGTADALYTAVTMPQLERVRRMARLKNAVEKHDIYAWLSEQMQDLELVALSSGRPWRAGMPPSVTEMVPECRREVPAGRAFV